MAGQNTGNAALLPKQDLSEVLGHVTPWSLKAGNFKRNEYSSEKR